MTRGKYCTEHEVSQPSRSRPTSYLTPVTGGELVEVHAQLMTQSRRDALMEQAVGRLSLERSVSAVTWAVRDSSHTPEEENGLDVGSVSGRRRLPLVGRWRG